MKMSYRLLTVVFLFSGCVAAQKVPMGTGIPIQTLILILLTSY